MEFSFKEVVQSMNYPVLQIRKGDEVIARGIHILDSVLACCDGEMSSISYPDTGVFVLLNGSESFAVEKKYEHYIDEDGKTTRDIIFQSRNAAAQFVLGDTGRTNNWK